METHTSSDCTLTAFRDASMAFDAAYALFAKACGLSESEYWSLLLVSEGVKTQSEISVRLSLSKQTLNSAFKSLVHKGLVRLEPLENNQRIKRIILTEGGERFVKENIARMHQLEEQAWQSLEENERASLTRLTKKFSVLIKAALEQA